MATKRYYMEHDDTKPRKKNEYYEIREYNVSEEYANRNPNQSRRDWRSENRYHSNNFPWWAILGLVILLIALCIMKPPTGEIAIINGKTALSADQTSIIATATIHNTTGAILLDLNCSAELYDTNGNVISKRGQEIAAFVLPGGKKEVTIILPTYGQTGHLNTRIEAKGRHIVWGII